MTKILTMREKAVTLSIKRWTLPVWKNRPSVQKGKSRDPQYRKARAETFNIKGTDSQYRRWTRDPQYEKMQNLLSMEGHEQTLSV